MDELITPDRLYSRQEILSKPSPIPEISGVYGWFFKDVPPFVLTEGCIRHQNMTLLYIGISPDKKNKPQSRQHLKKRITNHYAGNAEGSTLRRSLGILLTPESHYPLRRVGSGRRMTFTHNGEQWLDAWMEKNAYVFWVEHETPWELEEDLLSALSLPLNIQGNRSHPFAIELNRLRKEAIHNARELPIADETQQTRNP
jgi:hypothetical protein